MTPHWSVLLITFASTALLVGAVLSLAYETCFRYPATVRERIHELTGKSRTASNSLLLDIRQLAASASTAPSTWRMRVRQLLEQSGLRVEPTTVLAISFGLGVAAGIAAYAATQRWWTALVAFTAGATAPWVYVCTKRRARLHRLMSQLPDALDVICRAVRAGQTVPATFRVVADDFPSPISEEFRSCYEQQNLGISYDTALQNLARNTGIMELRILVVALLVQSRSGGNLTELLQNLASMVRKRLALQRKVKALTSEGRMQATVLIALPVVVFIAMYWLNREYAQVLLDRPWLLAGCVASQGMGAFVIQRMLMTDY